MSAKAAWIGVVIVVLFAIVLELARTKPDEVNEQIVECSEQGWFPVHLLDQTGNVVATRCVPNEDVARGLEFQGWVIQ